MPRPGPRPYECVRRAWHSDRHQPMRGSIIQQIFRLVTEAHSSATKKNKEWQEKLPVVVLKAEEIMYSKANSEAEYVNSETLWDRVNDAVNTIIRRDESTETGELLPPCVEAALNLGCIPVRASRSQRHSNPRSYLSPRAQEPASAAPRILDKSTDEGCSQLSPVHSGNQLNFARGATNVNLTLPVSQSNCLVAEYDSAAPRNHPFLYDKGPSGYNHLMTIEHNAPLNVGSVYPLYYGTHCQNAESQTGSRVQENPNTNTIIIGTPIGTKIPERSEMGSLRNMFSSSGVDVACKRTGQADYRDTHEKPFRTECDLSLRLGPFSDPCMRADKNLIPETGSSGPSSSQERGKYGDVFKQKSREICFFPAKVNDPVESCSRNLFLESESYNFKATMRKRNAPFGDNLEDGQFCWQPEPPSKRFIS